MCPQCLTVRGVSDSIKASKNTYVIAYFCPKCAYAWERRYPFMRMLGRYSRDLTEVSSKLVIVSASKRIQDQLRMTGGTDMISPDNIYPTDERVGATPKRA